MFLEKDPFPGNGRSSTSNCLGVQDFDIIKINKSSISASYTTNNDIHIIKIYEDKS